MKKRTGKVWTASKSKLVELVGKHSTFLGILHELGFTNTSGSYNTLKERLNHENIDFSHITLKTNHKRFPRVKIPLKEILVQNSTYATWHLKQRLIKETKWPYVCVLCKNTGTWQNQILILQMDHINGIHTDNRLENLRLLCPNCHSQTDTFMGKNKYTNKIKELG